MNTDEEKRLDNLFKKKLEDPVDEIRYNEGDWTAFEQMLGKPRRRVAYLWPVLSGVAAMLLLFSGWWTFRPINNAVHVKNNMQARHKTADTIIGKQMTEASKTKDTIMDNASAIAHQQSHDTIMDKTQYIAQTKMLIGTKPVRQQAQILPENNRPLIPVNAAKDTIINKAVKVDNTKNEVIALNQVPVNTTAKDEAQSPADVKQPASQAVRPVTNPGLKSIKAKPQLAFRPQYALSVVAAPDLNGVGSFQQSKVGTNIGLTFAVGLTRKLTVSTGALYSVKPYMTSFNNYRTAADYKWTVNPINVTADCRMLDIPLNVGYQVYHRQQNKISIGTGLSSYIMLHENYKFNYEYAGTAGPKSYTVPNTGKYFFGVVNLNATYERQINSKVGISIQPYMKLPLSNIGYSQVKLQTTGIAVGLSWNLNSLTKP